jgi:uncharacterized RDD family membrane protein YckC
MDPKCQQQNGKLCESDNMLDDADWYYLRDGGSVGPEATKRLLELLDQSVITRQTLVWRQGAADWQPLENALGLTADVPPALPDAPPSMPPIPTSAPVPVEKHPAPSNEYSDYAPHPWRRFFARLLDTVVGAFVVSFAVCIVLASIDQGAVKAFEKLTENVAVNNILSFAFAMLTNASLIGLTGSSLGKWIFGVQVAHMDGRLLGFRLALEREALVWWRGVGMGIPLVLLFTAFAGYKTLIKQQETSWDKDLRIRVAYRQATTKQMILNITGVVLWVGSFFLLAVLVNV